MKKLFIVLALTIFSSATFASNACYDICKSDANQMGLMCQKLRQNCMRTSSPDSIQFEMCMDDVAACLQTGKAINESCVQSCVTND
jgi:hypothetical protein